MVKDVLSKDKQLPSPPVAPVAPAYPAMLPTGPLFLPLAAYLPHSPLAAAAAAGLKHPAAGGGFPLGEAGQPANCHYRRPWMESASPFGAFPLFIPQSKFILNLQLYIVFECSPVQPWNNK